MELAKLGALCEIKLSKLLGYSKLEVTAKMEVVSKLEVRSKLEVLEPRLARVPFLELGP